MKSASRKESAAGTSEGPHHSMRFALVEGTSGGPNICPEISVFAVWDSFGMPYESMIHPIQLA